MNALSRSPERLRPMEAGDLPLALVATVDSRSTQMALLLDALIYAVAWTHVLLAPYTKVEESFTLHAMHDLLLYGGRPDALQKVRYNNIIVWLLLIRWAYPRSV